MITYLKNAFCNLHFVITRFFHQKFCRHENTEWQWWDAGYRIRVCKDCGLEDFGYHNRRFYYKIQMGYNGLAMCR